MGRLLRLLGFYLCIPIYTAILNLYEIFYYLASARFFTDDTIKTLNSNLYVLISVVMLFVFSATMLAAIVNPDLIEDKKKGVGAVFKRGIIGVLLIVLIPFAFDKAYDLQKEIMDKHLIEKTLVGMKFKNDETNTGGNGGKVIAGSLISSVIYPNVDSENGTVEIETDSGGDPSERYNKMVADVRKMNNFADYLNVYKKGTDDYAFSFNALIAIIAGIVADYILLMFAIDMAVRLFKLAFFELTAPISIIAYIAAGGDIFKKWATQVGITFLEVFLRVGAMAFYLFLISNLNSFANSESWSASGFEGLGWLLLKLLLIIGMLIFVNKIPNLVKDAFGFEIPKTGGIKGRLSNMAGVGKQVSEAWGKLTKTAGMTVLGAAAGVGALAAAPYVGTGALVGGGLLRHGWKKGFRGGEAWENTKAGKTAKGVAGAVRAYVNGGNPIKAVKDARDKLDEAGLTHGKEREEAKKVAQEEKVQRQFDVKFQDIYDYEKDANGNVIGAKLKDGINGVMALNKLEQAIMTDNDIPDEIKERLINYVRAKSVTASHNQIKTNTEKINSTFDALKSNTTSDEIRAKLSNIQQSFNDGKLTANGFNKQIDELVKKGAISTSEGATLRNNFGNIVETMEKYKNDKIFAGEYGYKQGGEIQVQKNGDAIKHAEKAEKSVKDAYDSIYNKMSDDRKKGVDRYVDKSEEFITQKVRDDKKYKVIDDDRNTEIRDASGNPIKVKDLYYKDPQNGIFNVYGTPNSQNGGNNNNLGAQGNNINGNIQGGTITVDDLKVKNLNVDSINGDFINVKNIPSGYTKTDSVSSSAQTTTANAVREAADAVITENEKLENEMKKIEERINEIRSKGSRMTDEDREEIEKLIHDLQERAAKQYENNGGPLDE